MARPTVLLADDDRSICTVLSQAIRRSGFNVVTTDDPNTLLDWVDDGKGDLVITDVMMPKGNGLEFLPKIASSRPDMPVIVISANNSLMTAVKANELGAFEYFPKPFDLDHLVDCVTQKLGAILGEDAIPADEPEGMHDETPLIGRSPAMQEVYKVIARMVPVDLTVMLNGESGTGKELVARTLHTLSPRSEKPFVAINMAAMPRELVESELFGHEKGAFTGATARKPGRFELAHGGTLFLDEIGDMPAEAQSKLLRTLQEREYTPIGGTRPKQTDVRIVCATHRDLSALVEQGSFREDLYYRLNVVPIRIPPLRERTEDIKSLVQHLLEKARKKGLPEKQISTDALQLLMAHSWPGNVRELENLIYRMAALSPDKMIDAKSVAAELQLPSHQPAATQNEGAVMPAWSPGGASLQTLVDAYLTHYFTAHKGELPASGLYDRVLHAVEPPLLRLAMEASNNQQIHAAELLGLNRNTLRKKLQQHGMLAKRGGITRQNNDEGGI